MNLHRLLAFFLALALGCPALATTVAAAVPVGRIQWLMAEEPSQPDAQGRLRLTPTEKVLAYLTRAWPEVPQTIVSVSIKRGARMLADGEPACHAAMLRTAAREREFYFVNTALLPPQQLVLRKEDLSRLPRNAAGEADLAALLARPALHGALIEGRSYGDAVDLMLARRPADSGLELFSIRGYSGGRLLPMLALRRIDYTIEYPGVVASLRARTPEITAGLQTLPIQGTSALLTVGIACPRTPWGLAAAQGIDHVLGTPEAAAMLRESIEVLLTPAPGAAQRAQLEAFFKARARPMPVR